MAASIITPVWNRSDLTMKFLYHHWQLFQDYDGLEWIIVDNGSVDNTPRIIDQWQEPYQERLICHRFDENKGFGPANNKGAALAGGDILIFINNDVVPMGDYITPICEQLKQTPEDLVGPELWEINTGWNTFDGQIIPYLGGWCFACTRPTWETLGGFDEQFVPCDYEDIDLNLTATRQGRRLIPIQLPLRHTFGETAQQLDGGRAVITEKNQKLFMQKWGFNEHVRAD